MLTAQPHCHLLSIHKHYELLFDLHHHINLQIHFSDIGFGHNQKVIENQKQFSKDISHLQ